MREQQKLIRILGRCICCQVQIKCERGEKELGDPLGGALFPVTALTHQHGLRGLNSVLSHSSVGQKSEMGLTGQKPGYGRPLSFPGPRTTSSGPGWLRPPALACDPHHLSFLPASASMPPSPYHSNFLPKLL